MNSNRNYWWRTIASFLLVLFSMPLGHALMILMERLMSPSAMHYAGFLMGLAGLFLVIVGVFAKGDTRQTLWGLFGGLLFWTGWVEFLFLYYARRYGVQPEIENDVIVTKPEYLIMPASFGMWMMVMTMYVFSTKNGCDFITWIQKVCFRSRRKVIAAQPMTRHTSIITFMELKLPRRPSPRYLPRRYRLSYRLCLYVQTRIKISCLGCQYQDGYCHRHHLLDSH